MNAHRECLQEAADWLSGNNSDAGFSIPVPKDGVVRAGLTVAELSLRVKSQECPRRIGSLDDDRKKAADYMAMELGDFIRDLNGLSMIERRIDWKMVQDVLQARVRDIAMEIKHGAHLKGEHIKSRIE